MINFFRRIRQRLLTENPPARSRRAGRFSKYLLYAIGEIVLVVIGILIALQINAWNELKILSRQEIVLLENLKSEFKVNLENLEEVKNNNQKLYKSAIALQNLIGKEKQIIKEHNVDSLLFNTLLINDFQPNQFVLSQIKTGEKLDIIKSKELKKMLYEWDKAMNAKAESFNMLNTYFMNSLIPFLDENSSIRNVDFYGNYGWSNKTPLKYNTTKMFQMLQFDNRLENHIWNVNSFDNSIDALITIARKINEEITKG